MERRFSMLRQNIRLLSAQRIGQSLQLIFTPPPFWPRFYTRVHILIARGLSL